MYKKNDIIKAIKALNYHFQNIRWKNESVARIEVDKGMQMINTGASEGELNNQLGIIFSQWMDTPNSTNSEPWMI